MHPFPLSLLPPALLAIGLALLPAQARAQSVHRCTTLSGETLYTDKRCEDLGAIDRLPTVPPAGVSASSDPRRLPGACPRSITELSYALSTAVGSRDVNRLASLYLWNNTSSEAANRIMDRLDEIAARPLVDIAPILPAPPPVLADDGSVIDANADGFYPQTTPQRRGRPVGFRLQQTLKNGSTPVATTLGIRKSYNCWWITF